MIGEVLKKFGLEKEPLAIVPLTQGLINSTWKISANSNSYILQKINDEVFTRPEDIAENISLLAEYLQNNNPEYFFVAPIKRVDGLSLVYIKELGYYRLFPFVNGSHTKETVGTPEQAYEAARQFGKFTRVLSGLDINNLKTTIPHFHDITLRYAQFQEALETGNTERIAKTINQIEQLKKFSWIVEKFEQIKRNPEFKLRVTHHDTKISNVLFDKNDKGICVIDLDTVMPGYFISDVGDMMRTYLSSVNEEGKDFEKIEVRNDFYKAIVKGYLSEMDSELTNAEKESFFYAGPFMIYMQALRFLTDYLKNDKYYGEKYPDHNLVRAENQLVLLRRLIEKKQSLASFNN